MLPSTIEQAIVSETLMSVSSPETRRSYATGLRAFFRWTKENGHPSINRSVVQEYVMVQQVNGTSGSGINQALAAIKLATREARERGAIDNATAEAILSVHGIKCAGVRSGHWLTREQAIQLLSLPDTGTLKGTRDRAMLSLLIGCAFRRRELSDLDCDHIQMRDGRPAIIDIVGKGRKTRSMGIPWRRWPYTWEYLEEWLQRAEIAQGRVLRRVNKADRVQGQVLSDAGIWKIVKGYAAELGIPDLAPHDLRRTHGKLARKGGAKLEQIQVTLGHNSVQTTQRYLNTALDFAETSGDLL